MATRLTRAFIVVALAATIGVVAGVSTFLFLKSREASEVAQQGHAGHSLPAQQPAAGLSAEACRLKSSADKTGCYHQVLASIITTQGTEQSLTVLERLADEDPDVLRFSHAYVHFVGQTSFAHYKDVSTAFTHCRDTFWSGCYHGVMQGYMSSLRQVEPQAITDVCTARIDTSLSLFIKYQCVHGLGHGLAMALQYDLPKSLSFCDALPTDWDRESCYGGVFMENIVGFENAEVMHPGIKAFLNPQDPLYPCNSVDRKYLRACYLIHTSAILNFNGRDFAQAFRECDRAPGEFVPTCYQSLGRDASGFTLRNAERVIGLCGLGSLVLRPNCIVGAAKDFVLNDAGPARGLDLCRQVDTAYKRDCYGAVGEILVSLYPDQPPRIEACARAEAEFVSACRTSAQIA